MRNNAAMSGDFPSTLGSPQIPHIAVSTQEAFKLQRLNHHQYGAPQLTQPLFNLVAARHATGMNHFAIQDHPRRGHDAIGHDVLNLFDFLHRDRNPLGLRDLFDQGNRCFAV